MTVIVLSKRRLEETLIIESSCIPHDRSCDLVGDTDGHCVNGWDYNIARDRNRYGIHLVRCERDSRERLITNSRLSAISGSFPTHPPPVAHISKSDHTIESLDKTTQWILNSKDHVYIIVHISKRMAEIACESPARKTWDALNKANLNTMQSCDKWTKIHIAAYLQGWQCLSL